MQNLEAFLNVILQILSILSQGQQIFGFVDFIRGLLGG